MDKDLKQFRVKIDSLAQLTKGMGLSEELSNRLKREGESEQDFIRRANKEGLWRQFDNNSIQVDHCIDDLYLAKFWCGRALGALSVPSPYVNDGRRHGVADIEPPADKVVFIPDPKPAIEINETPIYKPDRWESLNHIEKVDWLRQDIQKTIDQGLIIYDRNMNPDTMVPDLIAQQIHVHLTESRGWLGFELQRIREEGTD